MRSAIAASLCCLALAKQEPRALAVGAWSEVVEKRTKGKRLTESPVDAAAALDRLAPRALGDAERRVGHPSRALMVHAADQSSAYPDGYEIFLPWQHGAVLYGFLGANRCFEDPLLLQIAENVATTVEYSWVSAIRPRLGGAFTPVCDSSHSSKSCK